MDNNEFVCVSCSYNQVKNEHIPIPRILDRLDDCLNKNDMEGAKRLLENWREEALHLRDKQGELVIVNEMLGLYRKMQLNEKSAQAIDRALQLIPPEDRDPEKLSVHNATILLNTATTLKAIGRAAEGLPLYELVLSVYEKELESDDKRKAGLYNNYALALTDTKRYDEATKLYNKAIVIMSTAPDRYPDCAVTYVNMAHLIETQKGLDQGESEIFACLDKAEELLYNPATPRNSYFAYVCSKCAPSFGYFGYFITAKELTALSEEIYAGA